jgi:hypothetical protein
MQELKAVHEEPRFARYYAGGYETLNLYYLSDARPFVHKHKQFDAGEICRFPVESPSVYEIKHSGCVFNMYDPGIVKARTPVHEIGHVSNLKRFEMCDAC